MSRLKSVLVALAFMGSTIVAWEVVETAIHHKAHAAAYKAPTPPPVVGQSVIP
jgi:hypothetical protein